MLCAAALDALFRTARTHNRFLPKPIPDSTLEELYELTKFGPTSANCSPARFVFLRSEEAKARLMPALLSGNRAKTVSAPVTVIVAYDPKFYDSLPQLFPHADARSWFTGDETVAAETAFRNGTLQGAYLIMAARSLGLDSGAISGFDNARVDAEFFAASGYRSNFILNLGYGDPSALFPRLPRLSLHEACSIL